jgi:Transposase DDE domain group 1
VNVNRRARQVRVSADGSGLVSRAGTLLLRELTVGTGLAAWTEALLDTYQAAPVRHLPGRVLADLAVVIADGGDALTHLAVLRDQGKLFGPVASEPTAWRAVERVDEEHLDRLRAVRAAARERAWAAGAGRTSRPGWSSTWTRRSRSRTATSRTRPPPGSGPMASIRC